jgi:sugar phosphate isomerase/epimerase
MNQTEKNERNLKAGIFIWFGWRTYIGYRARLIKQAGFDTTCLWWAEEERANTGSLDDLPKIVRDCGLEIDNIHAPFKEAHLLSSENQADRKRHIDLHKQWIDDCAKHEIKKIVFHPCPDYENSPPPGSLLLDSISEILRYAEQAKITLAAENTWRRDYIDFVLGNLNSEYLGFCYDCGHDFLLSEKPVEILKDWGHRLVATHLHDNMGVNDDHLLPLTGKNDWSKIAAAWPKDYKGVLMLEVLGDEKTRSAEDFLKNAFENLMKLNLGRI